MHIPRSIIGILVLGLGATQAWDSNVLSAPWWIIAMVAIAVIVPAAALILTDDPASLLAAVIIMSLLLLAAKLVSPVKLPALLVIAVLAGVLIILANQQGVGTSEGPGDS